MANYFTLETGDSDTIFSFSDVKVDRVESSELHVPLRAVVRSFTSLKLASKISSKQLFYILGRLSWLKRLVDEYNEGIDLAALETATTAKQDDIYYTRYIRYQLVQALSGLGFQIRDANVKVRIPGIEDLLEALRELYKEDLEYYRSCLQDGVVVFDALQELYSTGTIVRGITHLGIPAGFRVVQSYFQERKSLFGFEQSFHLELQYVVTMGHDFAIIQFESVMSRWMGEATRKISDLFYAPVDEVMAKKMETLGEHYLSLGVASPQYLQHDPGSVLLMQGRGGTQGSSSKSVPFGGRIMIDVVRASHLGFHAANGSDDASYALMEFSGRYKRFKAEQRALNDCVDQVSGAGNTSNGNPDSIFIISTIPKQLLAITWPALVGFSFTTKSWCTCLVSGLKPIQFNDLAFEQLVLDPMRKRLIRALVRFGSGNNGQLEDMIQGKSGGSIFLLHGPAGVGKSIEYGEEVGRDTFTLQRLGCINSHR